MNFLAFIFGFCTGYFILHKGINININYKNNTDKDNSLPESTINNIIDQYEQFKKSEVDDKDVNNVAQEDREDISQIFKLFNGGE